MAERGGIFGIETEHVVLYVPEDESAPAPARPPFEKLEEVLFQCLLEGRKAARSSGIKGGYFLSNGGLVHLEAFVRRQADVPILEVATPECRSPRDALVYSRAFDEILEETSRRSREALRAHGYRGAIAFGKTNSDPRGVGLGCHENYLVRSPPTASTYALAALFLPVLAALFALPFAVSLAVLSARAAALVLERAAGTAGSRVKARLVSWLRRRRWFAETARVLGNAVLAAVFFPGIRVYSAFLRLVAFPRFVRHLTPFLVTRQILTGSGSLNFRAGRYELSQRARMARSLGKIVTRGPRKTVFDFKTFLYSPSALFREAKRLSLVLADSNLSDVPNLLKLGATALVIEMVEAGLSFDALRLRSPLKALREVSAEGPWKLLRLRSGLSKTAVEIQRAYLERAREHFRGRPEGRVRHGEILQLWEETLERLADRPTALADTLDWAAKKSILDEAILPRTNWKTFFDWGRVFEAAGLEAAAAANGLADLFRRAPPHRRLRVRNLAERAALDPEEFRVQRDLHFQARKIDLRFHELGGGAGYQRALEAEGLIRRLADEAEVLRATTAPPQDTRARIRAYYIEHSPDPELLRVDWTEIELGGHALYIPLPDPFAHRLPLE